jgi:hypothetical protein
VHQPKLYRGSAVEIYNGIGFQLEWAQHYLQCHCRDDKGGRVTCLITSIKIVSNKPLNC